MNNYGSSCDLFDLQTKASAGDGHSVKLKAAMWPVSERVHPLNIPRESVEV